MPFQFMVQLHYGEAASAVLTCDLARYLGALLRVAGIHGVSVAERNVAAAAAYVLAEESVRQDAFNWADPDSTTWAELLGPLSTPPVSLCLFRDACGVAWADGGLDELEAAQLEEMARELQIPDETRQRILDLVEAEQNAHGELLRVLQA